MVTRVLVQRNHENTNLPTKLHQSLKSVESQTSTKVHDFDYI